MAHRQQRGPQEVVMSGRPKGVLAAAVAALALLVPAVPATAMNPGPMNAPGTDVAAVDQQAPRTVVNAPGTDVAAPDQQAPSDGGISAIAAADTADGSLPTAALAGLIALGLAGLAFASRFASTRRRGRATA
jgi:hypothetical protein